MTFNPDAYKYYGIVAKSPSGSTAVRELVQGLDRLTEMAQNLIESDHDVKIYECVERKFEISTKVTISFTD